MAVSAEMASGSILVREVWLGLRCSDIIRGMIAALPT